MKLFFAMCFFLIFNLSVEAQIQIDAVSLANLEKLEQEYIDNDQDPKGIDLINNHNVKYDILKTAFENKGLELDLTSFENKILKQHPDLKILYRNYRIALKTKVKYFSKIESMAKTMKETYPQFYNKK